MSKRQSKGTIKRSAGPRKRNWPTPAQAKNNKRQNKTKGKRRRERGGKPEYFGLAKLMFLIALVLIVSLYLGFNPVLSSVLIIKKIIIVILVILGILLFIRSRS